MFIRIFFAIFSFTILFNGKVYAKQHKPKKIALLFLTREAPNHPNIWQSLLKNTEGKFSVYIHSKYPINHPYFSAFRIPHIVETSWSIHVKAWQVLIQEALKDNENTHFAFVSEACIPLYPLEYIHKIITADLHSHMGYAGPWWEQSTTREVHEIVPEFRLGNAEWIVLNRKHAQIVAKDKAVIRIVSRHDNDQESYFATLFAIHGCLDEICNHTYTYVNWKNSVNGGTSPYAFEKSSTFNEHLIDMAYRQGFLFARKFTTSYPEDVLFEMIHTHTPKD